MKSFIPSAFHYSFNYENIRIPKSIDSDTDNERKISIENYKLLTNHTFTYIKLPYVICDDCCDCCESKYNFLDSFTSYRRQKLSMPYEASFKVLMGNCKKLLYDDLVTDFEKFPPNPAADVFEAASLAIVGNLVDIKQYFIEIDAVNHKNESALNLCLQYNKYYLFFYLTRLYTYPFERKKQQLAEMRPHASENIKYLIDILMEYSEDILNTLPDLNMLLSSVENTHPNIIWTKWANEYLDIEHYGNPYILKDKGTILLLENKNKVSEVYDELITWSDKLLYEIFDKETLLDPLLFTRRSTWIMQVSIMLMSI